MRAVRARGVASCFISAQAFTLFAEEESIVVKCVDASARSPACDCKRAVCCVYW